MTETCLARIFVAYPDGLIVLGCSADPGHPDTHTAYYGAKLHSWPLRAVRGCGSRDPCLTLIHRLLRRSIARLEYPMPEMVRVVMRNTTHSPDGQITYQHEAVDHVPVDRLDAYLADARTRWASVDTHTEGE